MKPLFYILKKSLKNNIKELKKRPLILMLYILIAISFISMIATSFFMPSNITKRGTAEGYGAIAGAALLMVVYFGIKQGINNGGSFFRLADVNLVFTAPVSQRKVLAYGFIKQLSATLFTVLFLSFQIPNIRNNFPLKEWGMAIMLAGAFMLMLSIPIIGMLIYSITSKSRNMRDWFERGLNAAALVVIMAFLISLFKQRNFLKGAFAILNSSYFYYIPFIGWFKSVFMAAVLGVDSRFYINAGLIIASFAVMIYSLYKVKADYYEDVLAATEYKEEMLKSKKEGTGRLKNIKLKKARQKYKGGGAKAVFYRHMLEYKKAGYFFIDRNTFIIAAIGVASTFFFPDADMATVLFFSVYMLFFFTQQGKWGQELQKPFIYLIPDSSLKKLFYATLPQAIKNFVDGVVLFTIAGLMLGAGAVLIVLSALLYMTFGIVYIYGDVLSRKLFGSIHSRNLKLFTRMFIVIMIILPGMLIFTITGGIFKGQMAAVYYSYIALILYNLLASLGISYFGRRIFEQLEMY